jgi:hypothetical protein
MPASGLLVNPTSVTRSSQNLGGCLKALFFVIALFCLSASAQPDAAVIKTSQLICGAVSCRLYILEHASVKGTVIKVIGCPSAGAQGQATSACTIDVVRDKTHGSIEEAIAQFDDFVAQDDGD